MSIEIAIKKKLQEYTLDVTLQSEENLTALLGASGSGKSMILKCISGIETPDSGVIKVNGRTLFDGEKKINLKPQDRNVGYLFQDYALFPHMTVRQNIGCVLQSKNKQAKIADLLHRFELEKVADQYSNQLSGGQQQRVALARVIASEPEILLLDEPFSALDTFLKEKVELEMKNFLHTYPGDVIFVTHNRNEAYRLCERLVILDQGKKVEAGQLSEIFAHPNHVATARLTGVKNISPIKKIDDYTLEALDWQIQLKTSEKISEQIRQVGIRAHDFTSDPNQENAFRVTIVDQTETLFEQQFYCLPTRAQKELWWKVNKGQNYQFQGVLAISPEKIQLLKE